MRLRKISVAAAFICGYGLAASGQAPPQPQAPARDNATAPPLPTNGVIKGRVTAAATNASLYRVRVTLNGSIQNPPATVTDVNGYFELTAVPPGIYTISAARAGYLPMQYGQRLPRERGRTVEIAANEVVDRIDIALPRSSVMAGRIRDHLGEPMSGVRVEAMEMRVVRGQRLPVQAGAAITNDIGEFRIAALMPGTYLLRASTAETWPDENEQRGSYAYAQTLYPGVAESDRAERIEIGLGQDLENLDWSLVVGRAVTIRGTVLNSAGEPIVSQLVGLDRITRTIGGALSSAGVGGSTRTDARGAFEIRDMAPGEYNLYASGAQNEVANITPLMITDTDFNNLVLTTARAASVRGTVVSDDGRPLTFPAIRLRIEPLPTTPGAALQAWGAPSPTTVGPDWGWRFANIQGPHLFRVTGLPDDWMLSAVRVDDRDITDIPLEINRGAPEVTGLRIVVSQNAARLTGVVSAANGSPAPDSTVIVFPVDERGWAPGTRSVKSVRPNDRGEFIVGGLPAGSYLAIAREFVGDGDWEDPGYLRTLVSKATRVELTIGSPLKIALTISTEVQ